MKACFPIREAAASVLALCVAQTALADELEVLHRWTSAGESAALNEIAKTFEDTGFTWIDTPVANDQEALAVSRTVGGNPPGAFQFNTGTDMDELVDAGLLRSLSDVAAEQNWQEKMPPLIWDAISRDGEVFAVPLNVQNSVWVWYSPQVFEAAGAEFPTTYDELFVALDKIKAAGFVPMALGGQAWQEQILFDKVLVGVSGRNFYQRLYSDDYEAALASDEFAEAARTFGRLRNYVDEGSPGRDWNVATNLVVTHQAGINIMGDWAKAEFLAAGLEPGKDFGCMLGPGDTTLLLSGDVFVMPQSDDESVQRAQVHLAKLMMSEDMQIRFNQKKGSMPVRLGVDPEQFDICAKTGMDMLQTPGKTIPATYFFLSNDRYQAIANATTEFWNDADATVESYAAGIREAFETTD